jgi:hypothetical protein
MVVDTAAMASKLAVRNNCCPRYYAMAWKLDHCARLEEGFGQVQKLPLLWAQQLRKGLTA